ncbi:MAG: methyltransferase domain-containing protein [Bryobacteraceae bacterium]
MEEVARHYGRPVLLDTLLGALRDSGTDIANLTLDDLAPMDEFHIRGREATAELADLSGLQSHWHVVDVGCGLGGSSRYLAQRFGCRVTGVDLTPEFCEVAADLTRRVGLDGRVEFRCASALAMPLDDASADLAWTQHVQMNIEDKAGLYREIARVLKPGGLFAFHDILAGPGGETFFPVHWADHAGLSHLIAPEALRELLQQSGFRILEWRDKTAVSRDWFVAAMERARSRPPNMPPPRASICCSVAT